MNLKNFWQKQKRVIIFYAALLLIVIPVLTSPTLFCSHINTELHSCLLDFDSAVPRIIFILSATAVLVVFRNIRSRPLFIEFLSLFLVSGGGAFVLAYKNYVVKDSVDMLNTNGLTKLVILWVISVTILLIFQDRLKTFRRRILLYVPIIFCEVIFGFFAGYTVVDIQRPPDSGIMAAPPSSCFPEGTLVWTSNGTLPIESLRVGDIVFARDLHTQTLVKVPVKATIKKQRSELIVINDLLRVTPEHPMAVLLNDQIIWKEAGKISIGDCLVSQTGACLQIHSITHVHLLSPISVINLSVAVPHNFFVIMGDTPVLVHNKQAIPPEMKAQADAFWGQIGEINAEYPWAQIVPEGDYIRISIEGREDIRVASVETIKGKLNEIISSTSTSVLEVGGKVPWSEVLRLINTCQIIFYSDYNVHQQIGLKGGGVNYSTNATYSMIEAANQAASSTCSGMFVMSHY